MRVRDPFEGFMVHFGAHGLQHRLTLSLFLSALETTIVATALGTIAAHFDDYRRFSWIVTAYLIAFNGFLLLHARLSDIFGRFAVFYCCLAIFAIFSGLCGAAQSMIQLIVFRALQGIGASGLFSLTMVIVPDITPDRWLGVYSGVVSSVFALSSILGPLLGGIIAQHSTWRWVFLLNVPGAVLSALMVAPAMRSQNAFKSIRDGWRQIDVPGSIFFLAATILLIYALQSANSTSSGFGWSSSVIIGCLVGSGASFICFIIYELIIERKVSLTPLFPLRLLLQCDITLLMLSAFFMGCSFYSTIIQLPQRIQQVNDKSPTISGVLLLPVLLPSAAFSALSGGLYRKFPNVSPLLLTLGGCLQVVGVGLLSTLPTGVSIPNRQYGYEVMTGVGFGLMLPSFMILARDWVSEDEYVAEREIATAMGLVNTFRTLGGCVSIAVNNAIMNEDLPKYASFLTPSQLDALETASLALLRLSPDEVLRIRVAYGEVYNQQFFVVAMLAIPSAVAAGIMLVRQYKRKA
ncbi:major facilitator superfamily domain-containing protein [Aspergillus bertholletiae]|uniref:Major facilitator superfamily domain-containing protein n=1 Tax=Aspergillus bertholletiae TaxID=1226010 RepID=A0A5N7BFD1_9EURO|nr:major facilitator superfamily domain-containing protein [Aspergillus bertholletiae]